MTIEDPEIEILEMLADVAAPWNSGKVIFPFLGRQENKRKTIRIFSRNPPFFYFPRTNGISIT
jgi:hypothetical protein